MFIAELFDSVKKNEGQLIEAKALNKRVRVVKGSAAGQEGWIGEIRHGLYVGAPKTYTVDLDRGGSVQVRGDEIRLVKKSDISEEHVALNGQPCNFLVKYDVHGSNHDVPLYRGAKRVAASSAAEAVAFVKELIGGRNHRVYDTAGNDVTESFAGPVGMEEFTITFYDDAQDRAFTKKLFAHSPEDAVDQAKKLLHNSNLSVTKIAGDGCLHPGDIMRHHLLGPVKVLAVKGEHAEVVDQRSGRHFNVDPDSLLQPFNDDD